MFKCTGSTTRRFGLSLLLAALLVGVVLFLGRQRAAAQYCDPHAFPCSRIAAPMGDTSLFLPAIVEETTSPVLFGQIYSGEATYYYADGSGACHYEPTPHDLMVAALNAPDYGDAHLCGAYVQVTGPEGVATVRIVDLCPGCAGRDLDLSEEAFAAIAPLSAGRVPITWQLISPPLEGPIAYRFYDSSNQWWTAVQLRNHRNPIARFEFQTAGGAFVEAYRQQWNYFVAESGMGPGPYTFRVTDIFGNTLADENIPLTPGAVYDGSAQFPAPPGEP